MSKPYDKYVKVVEAEFPRMTLHSTIPSGASLAVVFDHYRLKRDRKSNHRRAVNLFFMAGTGMTKAIWQYHIKRLFQYSEDNEDSLSWQLVNAVAIDLVSHGESAVENNGRLGYAADWREGAHDLIQVAKSLRLQGSNVVIGHSMGGYQSLYACTLAPLMFEHAIIIEPVIYGDDSYTAKMEKMNRSLNKIIKTEFPSENEFDSYFRKKSIFKNFNKEILDDFLESEKIIKKDGSTYAKTSKEHQMICYLCGGPAIKIWKEVLSNVNVPVIHVMGKQSTWTPEGSSEKIRNQLKYVKPLDIDGGHLLNCEAPGSIIKVILDSLNNNVDGQNGNIDQDLGKPYRELFEENYKKLYSSRL
ncbi:hypothetical protein BN7_4339 [Wickerhamomyces ciferrii]|uniref:AB hydrolase-1 domain-containing protein n=1 Tax=Wickerhamomyces ciferrii (strain ATCC 14091 / BCRC 22168 / CBS 111 / JCM 3599 / NBRC 0793 / NRRL Y-1031 F-60-10) TaxID=1206466 RepID=K0KPB2_WICCF|nr:uncharacterized protein BN7_4339 [Wickerhamomyces ciferrii]CCH44771.1 hypothetical protein BN7_4339 [Wickerhamomyces ciferrii]